MFLQPIKNLVLGKHDGPNSHIIFSVYNVYKKVFSEVCHSAATYTTRNSENKTRCKKC